jgi:hypothetical protein
MIKNYIPFIKKLSINSVIFFFITIAFVNQIHLHLNSDLFEKVENKNEYVKKDKTFAKNKFSSSLVADNKHLLLNRDCIITGDFSDRHKVRWVKSLFLKKFFLLSEKLNQNFPYYSNILLHSFLIYLSLFLLNKTFSLEKKYTYLFLLYVTFIFQGFLSEYSYSIFETFFLCLSLYASKHKKIILFLFSGILATLNRESGFIILLSWLIFNKEYKRLVIFYILTSVTFILFNFDILKCLMNPKFFIPLEDQRGQTDLYDLSKINLISLIKLIILNFLLPFGLAFYYLFKTEKYNKVLLIMLLIYLLAFTLATPLHHVSIRLIILPLIFSSIYFFTIKEQKI